MESNQKIPSIMKSQSLISRRVWKLLMISFLLLGGCKSTFELKSVDYSMLLETVMTPEQNGTLSDRGYGLKFNIRPIQYLETGDSTQVNTEYRLIRDVNGYYYITSPGFKNVYIMKPTENALRLHRQVLVAAEGLERPAFNQRNPMIQLIDGGSRSFMLNNDGLVGER
jgi:hypothetical protein